MTPALPRHPGTWRTRFALTVAALACGMVPGSTCAASGAADSDETDSYAGIVQFMNVADGSLGVRGFWSTKNFDLGRNCRISLEAKAEATAADLAPGQYVRVHFVRHDGVRIASEVIQQDQSFTGFVSQIDPTNRTFRVERDWSARTFQVGDDCQVVLRDGSKHPFDKLELGQRVAVTYLKPGSREVAQAIEERSLEFTGRVEAIDARGQTIGAKTLLVRHSFRVGEDCQFVIDGQLRGELKDLRIGESVRFNYEDIDGVLVVNRVELLTTPAPPQGTASQGTPHQGSPES